MEGSVNQNLPSENSRPALGFWSSYFFTINTIIGAGVLSIPYAYKESGWLFSFFFQLMTVIQSIVLTFLLLEIMSKVEVLMRQRQQGHIIPTVIPLKLFNRSSDSSLLAKPKYSPQITDRRVDLPECVRSIFGQKAGTIYCIIMGFYIYGTQLGFTAVFGTSLTSTVPIFTLSTCNLYDQSSYFNDCRFKYWFWLFVYGICMIFLVLRGITEQKAMQVAMGWMRFFLIALMSMCCLINIFTEKSNTSDDHHTPQMPALINIKKLGVAIPILMQSTLYQFCTTSIVQHVQDKQRTLPILNITTGITTLICYGIMGLIIPPGVQDLSSVASLSFRNYSAGYSQSERPWWTYIIEYFVILFPALDVFSGFPLFSISNTNNLISIFYGVEENKEVSKCALFGIKLLSCFPPLFIAVFVSDLGTILEWNGLLGFIMIPIAIPLIYIGVQQLVPELSPYRYFKSNKVSFIQVSNLSITVLNILFVILTILFNVKVLN